MRIPLLNSLPDKLHTSSNTSSFEVRLNLLAVNSPVIDSSTNLLAFGIAGGSEIGIVRQLLDSVLMAPYILTAEGIQILLKTWTLILDITTALSQNTSNLADNIAFGSTNNEEIGITPLLNNTIISPYTSGGILLKSWSNYE